MVRALWTLVAAVAFAAIGDVAAQANYMLTPGMYYKPCALKASGRPNTNEPYHRSPCPAINALANHGHIPRDGQGVTKTELKAAVMRVFNMAEDIAARQVSRLPDVFSITILSNPPLNHDLSLVHRNSFFDDDPMTVNLTLAYNLFNRADSNGMISTAAVASVRKELALACMSGNPPCMFDEGAKNASFLQAALLLKGLGQGDAISTNHAKLFLVEERIPDDYMKSANSVTIGELNMKSAELMRLAA